MPLDDELELALTWETSYLLLRNSHSTIKLDKTQI